MAAADASDFFELAVHLERASGRIGATVAAAVTKTAYDIEADAKQLAPVDTGNLRNSISTTIEGDGRFGRMAAEIGPTAEYGAFVEYGTSRSGPQPYMRPAFDRRAPQLETVLDRILGDLL